MPRRFTIFEQGGTTTDRSKGRLGIGLALVKNLVELHGGRVAEISRRVGTGSEFIVTLPIVPSHSEAKSAICATGSGAIGSPQPSTRVLLVDDNADGLASMRAFLADVGFDVITGLDPIAALDIADGFLRDLDVPYRSEVVPFYLIIVGQQHDSFCHRLTEEKPVERVFVKLRERRDFERMLRFDGQFFITSIKQVPAEDACVNLKVVTS
jgi:hypothetical protein